MKNLINYTLHLADNALILAQRNGDWCGHGPILEQDIAITNITLDLIGQARNLFQYAAQLQGGSATEDSLAYTRVENEYTNCLLVEQPNGDWGQTILRQFLFSSFQYLQYEQLQQSKDDQLAAIAAKSLKEVAYHVRWSSEWVIRLGDGTEESHQRMQDALENLWPYTGEMLIPAPYELNVCKDNTGIDPSTLKEKWNNKVTAVLTEATLNIPSGVFMQKGGKEGLHTEYMGIILTDLQYMQRVYPNASW